MDMTAVKPQVMLVLGGLETALDTMLKAETQEQFNMTIDGIMALVGPLLPMPAPAAAPATPTM
jgi:hypothetical protein